MTYFPKLQRKQRFSAINNSDIHFLKHTVQLQKTCIITATAMKNQIKS